MAPTPADLDTAADALRRSATFLVLAFEPVGPRSDGETWEGPAAASFRRDLAAVEARVAALATALRGRATALEQRAEHRRRVWAEAEEARWARDRALHRSPSVFADRLDGP
ncbi:MAG TPA: hypothetical protein VEW93_01110 [Acidimicrobiales bacterium]|nr:hypothetical protein [Acidimicrobiales bacterium]